MLLLASEINLISCKYLKMLCENLEISKLFTSNMYKCFLLTNKNSCASEKARKLLL